MIWFTDSKDGHWFPVRTLLLSGDGYAFSADGGILTIRNPITANWQFYPTLFPANFLAGSADGKVPLRPLGLIKVVGPQDPGETYLGGDIDLRPLWTDLGQLLAAFRADPTFPPTVTVTDMGGARCRLDFAPGQPAACTVPRIRWDYWLASSLQGSGYTSLPTPPPMPDCTALIFPPGPAPWQIDVGGTGPFFPGEATVVALNAFYDRPGAGRILTSTAIYGTDEGDIWNAHLVSAFTTFSIFLPPGESLASFYGVNHLTIDGRIDQYFVHPLRPDPVPHTDSVPISGNRAILLIWGWDIYDPARPETVGQSAYSQVRAGKGTVLMTIDSPRIDLTSLCTQVAPTAPNRVAPKLWFALVPSPLSPDGFAAGGWPFVTQSDVPWKSYYYADLTDMTRFGFSVLSLTPSA